MKEDTKKDKKTTMSPMKSLVMGVIAAVVGVLIISAVVFALGLYKTGWSDSITQSIKNALSSPVAIVNGEKVSYAEFTEDVETLSNFYAVQSNSLPPGTPVPTEEEIKTLVLDRLIQTVILYEVADDLGVSITSEAVDAEYALMVQSAGSEEIVLSELQELYGWGSQQFKEKVLEPYLIQQGIQAVLKADQGRLAGAEQRANEAFERVNAGEDFATLAVELSEDPTTGSQGGSLGWFGRGAMVPEFETAAFALASGVVSSPVLSDFGYHLILVHETEEDDEGVRVRVNASHILISIGDSEAYLQSAYDSADIERNLD